ncbi:MAG: nuclear transport factor 2 family protein [Gemmatimonadaceae bacterium]
MRRYLTALLAIPVCISLSSAQGTGGAQAAQNVQPRNGLRSLTPLQLEDQWTTALVNRDAHTFDQLLSPNFVYTENNAVMSRGDVIKSVNGPDRVTWARNEGMKLHDFGDVHVITGVLHLKGSGNKGASFDKRYQFTDTWQKRGGRWRIIAAQDYLIP